MSEVLEQGQHDRRDQELEHLCRLVRDLELKVRGRRRRRNRSESLEGLISMRGSHGEASCQFDSCRSRDRSRDFVDRDSVSSERCRPRNAAIDTMSCVLRRTAWSPFSDAIKRAYMPRRFSRLPFISYDGKIDPIEHVNNYIQMMSLHSQK